MKVKWKTELLFLNYRIKLTIFNWGSWAEFLSHKAINYIFYFVRMSANWEKKLSYRINIKHFMECFVRPCQKRNISIWAFYISRHLLIVCGSVDYVVQYTWYIVMNCTECVDSDHEWPWKSLEHRHFQCLIKCITRFIYQSINMYLFLMNY